MKIDENLIGEIRKASKTNNRNKIFLVRRGESYGDRVSWIGVHDRPGYENLCIMTLYEEKEAGENLFRNIAERFGMFCDKAGFTEIRDILYQTAHAPLFSEDSDDFPYIHAWEANAK